MILRYQPDALARPSLARFEVALFFCGFSWRKRWFDRFRAPFLTTMGSRYFVFPRKFAFSIIKKAQLQNLRFGLQCNARTNYGRPSVLLAVFCAGVPSFAVFARDVVSAKNRTCLFVTHA